MDDEFKETVKKFRARYEQEYDTFVSTGIRINDNLLLVNSAIIAVLVASDKTAGFKYSILLFFLSVTFSLLSLLIQKELSRSSSIKFLTAAIQSEEANTNGSPLNQSDFPSTADLRKKSGYISILINLALLSFFVASSLALIKVFCEITI